MIVTLQTPSKEAFNRAVVSINNWANGIASSLLDKVKDVDTRILLNKAQELKEKTNELMKKVTLSNTLILNMGKAADKADIPNKKSTPRRDTESVLKVPSYPIQLGTNYRESDDTIEQVRNLNVMLRNVYQSLNRYLGELEGSVTDLPVKIDLILEGLDIATDIVESMTESEDFIQDAFIQSQNKKEGFLEEYEEKLEDVTPEEGEVPSFDTLPEDGNNSFGKWAENNNFDLESGDASKQYRFTFTNLKLNTGFGNFNFSGDGSCDITDGNNSIRDGMGALGYYSDSYTVRLNGLLYGTQGSSKISATFTGRVGFTPNRNNFSSSLKDGVIGSWASKGGMVSGVNKANSVDLFINSIVDTKQTVGCTLYRLTSQISYMEAY